MYQQVELDLILTLMKASKYAIATIVQSGNNSGTTTSGRTQNIDSNSSNAGNFIIRNLNMNNTNATVDDNYIGVIVFMDT